MRGRVRVEGEDKGEGEEGEEGEVGEVGEERSAQCAIGTPRPRSNTPDATSEAPASPNGVKRAFPV